MPCTAVVHPAQEPLDAAVMDAISLAESDDDDDSPQPRQSLVLKRRDPHVVSTDAMTWPQLLESAAGFVYVAATVAMSALYLGVLFPSLDNDMGWTGFHSSGTHVFLGVVCNVPLGLLATRIEFALVSAAASILVRPHDDDSPTTTMALSKVYPRMLLLQSTTALDDVIASLHVLKTLAAFEPLHFCFVDFDRRFGLARSRARQARCDRAYRDNAAVYLESIVRNMHADLWDATFGNVDGLFLEPIAARMTPWTDGQAWLAAARFGQDDVAAEAAHWRAYNLTRWQMQWHNAWQPGIVESIAVGGSLGVRRQLALKKIAFVDMVSGFTSQILNDGGILMNAYVAMMDNASLITTVDGASVGDALVSRNYAVASTPQSTSWQRFVGPYATNDAWYVPHPPSVGAAVAAFTAALVARLEANATLRLAFTTARLPPAAHPVPPRWVVRPHLDYFGGNPMCNTMASRNFVLESFGFDDACTSVQRFAVAWTAESVVFALSMTNASSPLTDICAMAIYDDDDSNDDLLATCTTSLQRLSTVLARFGTPTNDVLDDVADVHVIQFARDATMASNMLLQQTLLSRGDDPVWTFFGWLLVYEWAMQSREVVRFDGDVASISILSRHYVAHAFSPDPFEIPQWAGRYIKVVTAYVTVLVGVVACVMGGYGVATRFRVLGRNLLRFNRIVGSVWVGRILLALRALTAADMLSTPLLALAHHDEMTHLEHQPRPVWATCLLVSEASWTMVVLQDAIAVIVTPYSYYAAPASSCLAWLALVVYAFGTTTHDVPVTLERQCTTQVFAMQVECTSGLIEFGQPRRLVEIGALQLVSFVVVYAVVVAAKWRRERPVVVPILMSSAPEAFLDVTMDDASTMFDRVTCVMCGLLTLQLGGVEYIFDVKAWAMLQRRQRGDGHRRQSVKFEPNTAVASGGHWPWTSPTSFVRRLLAFMALLFMVLSLGGNIVYMSSTQVNMANDFLWAHVNASGSLAYVSNWYAKQLMLTTPNTLSVALDRVAYADTTAYNTSSVAVSSSPFYAHLIQYEAANSIEIAVQGLRDMDACQAPWIMTQYCWLDFNRLFEMANSETRQRRCERLEATNGAVFLEAVLRNIDTFQHCLWRGAWDVAIANDLRQSSAGLTWLAAMERASQAHKSVGVEASHWRSVGLSTFTTQFQNFKHLGVVENYDIQNAFGVNYPITLKLSKASMALEDETTMKLYWSFANDLSTIASSTSIVAGASLLRTSPMFAFANHSIQNLLISSGYVASPLAASFAAVTDTVGPFGSIDAKHIPCPASVRRVVQLISEAVASLASTHDSFQLLFRSLSKPWVWLPLPLQWKDVPRVSGTHLCDAACDVATTTLLSQWTYNQCSCDVEHITTTGLSTLVAAIATIAPVVAVCANQCDPLESCQARIGLALDLIHTYMAIEDVAKMQAMAMLAQADVAALTLSLIQFAAGDGSLLQHWLFADDGNDDGFGFLAWEMLVEWVGGNREVVSFEGDGATLVLPSATVLDVNLLPSPLEIPVNGVHYSRTVILYITGTLAVVAGVVMVYIVRSAGHIEAWNVLAINQVAGLAWVGRPLLCLRSIVATCLLSTAQLQLRQYGPLGFTTAFKSTRLEWYKVVLASGEMTWFVYVVSDILIPLTKQHTTSYAIASMYMVWLAAAIRSFAEPVGHTATVHRVCHAPHLDFELACSAGTFYIGSVGRFCEHFGIAVAMMGLCFVVVRLWRPLASDPKATMPLFLSGSCKYMFALDAWNFKQCLYLDKASAAITGLLSIQLGHTFYVLDIKLWRFFVLEAPTDDGAVPRNHPMYESMQHALPLVGNGATF
ncbi:Aste57867_16221 [Aphanomyces stellatus]|uniref:Aste57867_16221 protein n=1 Tax=Aphanomyces stellatus TaxID=120398 RepID=A0A485L867_9STRA|nr:hypothetical protein As57867_016164 [Aphanomyces stellatus]VFT92999.1 Aste57867_16221 [Aphanomyces stellatus]